MKKPISSLVMAALALVANEGNIARAQTFDIATDFYSVAQPTGNPWSYGTLDSFPTGAFHNLSFCGNRQAFDSSHNHYPVTLWCNNRAIPNAVTIGLNRGSAPVQFPNESVSFPPNVVDMDPELLVADVRWVAPFEGDFQITCSFQHEDTYGGGNPYVNVAVIHTDNFGKTHPLFTPAAGQMPRLPNPPVSFNKPSIHLLKGEKIDIAITGNGSGSYAYLTTGVTAKIKTLAVTSIPQPVLVLCADQLVTDICGNLVAVNQKVRKWGNVLAQPCLPDPMFPGAEQTNPLKQPQLVVDGGRSWIRFDGAKTFLTTFFGDSAAPACRLPCSTVFVVMRSLQSPSVAEINGFSPGLPSAPQTLAQLQTQRALYNPPMTLIGDQTDSVFGEFGLCGGGAGAGIPTFHLEVNNPDLEVHRLVADTSPNCCDGKMHILAFTQEYAGSSYKVYIYVDNTKFGPYDVTGSVHGLGLTSIGGGFNYAQMDGAITLPNGDLVHENPALGINTPNTFAYAANFFAGDISAVVAYNQVLADADVATVTTAFQGAPDGLW